MSMKNLPLTRLLLLLLILAAACFSANAFQDHPSPSLDNSRESLIQARGNFKSSASPSADYYQPALIGFRPEGGDEVTSNGISVIEANTPIRLTLFGELFTTNTIVAFTTEFRQDFDLDPALSTHTVDQSKPQQAEVAATTSAPAATTTTATPETSPSKSEFAKTVDHNDGLQAATQANGTTTAAQVVDAQLHGHRQFAHRRRTQSKSYDCTDYNRIISYKLNEANILSPNIAVIEVTLPEISAQSGLYYYFCLKQPALGYSQQSAREHLDTNATEQLIWVHQGAEWWVTLRVEPPFLSIANDCFLIVLLLVLSAVASGLNLGLMSLDMNELAVISSCGDQRERSYARTIAPLRKRGNYLLCALLLSNVAVNSTLTVILEQMTSGLVAVIGSTLAIVVLGEIVPQAICARQGLAIGARTIYVTYAFMILTFPLSYPISWLLDHVLGAEKGHVYDRERLMEFIKITGHHTQLDAEEVAIISGALKLKKIKVDQIMTRIEDVFMLPIDCKLDRETIKRIIEKGYSRIPVYEFGDRKQIVALILAKDLALLDPDDHTPIANMLMYCRHPLIFIEDDATLDVALNEFKTGKSHMAVVRQIYDDGETDKYYEAIGVVTLEDVIEEVLQAEINDETDILSDNRRKRRRTDCAQLSHLMIDELTRASSGSQQSGSHLTVGAAMLQNSCDSSQPLCGKQIQTSLSSHLTSVSIGNPPAETKPHQSQFAANLQESSGQFEQKQITVIEVADRSPAQSRKRQPEVAAEVDEPGDRDALRVVSDPESGGGEHLRQRRDTQVREHESLGLELERPDSGLLVRAAQFFTNIMP